MQLSPSGTLFIGFLFFAFAMAFVSGLSLLLGPRKHNAIKADIYECGIPVVDGARTRMSLKFFLTAILFILFDIEALFLYLWASIFGTLGWFGVVEIGVFVSILLAGYVYLLKRGALDWE